LFSAVFQATLLNASAYDNDRNDRSKVREKLSSFVSNLTVSDATSMSLITSVLSDLTKRSDEISRDMAVY
jgi:hypothetical protein